MNNRKRLEKILCSIPVATPSEEVADILDKNGVIALPCKIGETVWVISKSCAEPFSAKFRLDDLARQNVAEWLKKNEEHIVRRKLKIVCIALNDEFGFGGKRLARLISAINKTSKEWDDNPVFWTQVDKRLEQMGIPFEKENYDELEY